MNDKMDSESEGDFKFDANSEFDNSIKENRAGVGTGFGTRGAAFAG